MYVGVFHQRTYVRQPQPTHDPTLNRWVLLRARRMSLVIPGTSFHGVGAAANVDERYYGRKPTSSSSSLLSIRAVCTTDYRLPRNVPIFYTKPSSFEVGVQPTRGQKECTGKHTEDRNTRIPTK